MKSNWRIKEVDENSLNEFSSVLGLNKNIASILIAKGQTNINDAFYYINPKLSKLHSPFLMKGMFDTVTRVREAIDKNEKIGIFADSDLDGLTSLTILLNLFNRLNIDPYYRFAIDDEDYGLRKEVIDEMLEKDIDLLITLDCGIRDVDEIKYAKSLDIDVIICDHHEQDSELPEAIIINPKLWGCDYPFKELAGVGVTFKLCHGILLSYLQSFNKQFLLVTKDNEKIYVSHIKNGVLEEIETITKFSDLEKYNNKFAKEYNIVLYDVKVEREFVDHFKGAKFFQFDELLRTILKEKDHSENIPYNKLCEIFSINQHVYKNKYEIINSIFAEIEYNNSEKIKKFIDSIMDLVSIGTVADIMPLTGENRTIVHYGLKLLNTTNHPGLSMLVHSLSGKVNTKKIAWEISPLLNTPGRFGKTNLLAQFFLEKNPNILQSILNEITILNEDRKKLVTYLFEKIKESLQNGEYIVRKNLVFIMSEKIPEGLCGLLANRVSDFVKKPVIIVSQNGKKEYMKGSGRTMGDFNFFSYVKPLSMLFEKIGGHPQAFGFTVKEENINKIKNEIGSAINDCYVNNTAFQIDLDISIEEINYEFINSLELFEPFGRQNEECIFLTKDLVIKEFKRFGKKGDHGKYIFHNNSSVEAIGWNMADTMTKFHEQKQVDIVYTLENNTYNGRTSSRMMILDID